MAHYAALMRLRRVTSEFTLDLTSPCPAPFRMAVCDFWCTLDRIGGMCSLLTDRVRHVRDTNTNKPGDNLSPAEGTVRALLRIDFATVPALAWEHKFLRGPLQAPIRCQPATLLCFCGEEVACESRPTSSQSIYRQPFDVDRKVAAKLHTTQHSLANVRTSATLHVRYIVTAHVSTLPSPAHCSLQPCALHEGSTTYMSRAIVSQAPISYTPLAHGLISQRGVRARRIAL